MTMKPRLIVEQKITTFVNKYAVYQANEDGSKGQLLAFAAQKRFNIKERINFFSDESQKQPVFSFRAEKALDIHGRYFVEDTDGKLVGSFKKQFGRSLVNSTWDILNGDKPLLTVSESSMALAVFRRFGGMIPVVGGIVDIIVLLLRYHFVFTNSADDQEVGTYQKTTLLRDHYKLSMTDEAYSQVDWRVFASMAVALDALQSR